MMPKLRNGDYVPNTRGGFVRLEDREALLMQALFRLQCRRGAVPYRPELGSRLWKLRTAKPSSRRSLAMAYCAEALRELPLTVTDVVLAEQEDGLAQLKVQLRYQNEMIWMEVGL